MNALLDLQKKLFLLAKGTDLVLHQKDIFTLLSLTDSSAARMMLQRAVAAGIIRNPVRSIYLFTPGGSVQPGSIFKLARRLRNGHFNYLSLESVLAQAGLIAQLPLDRITIMTSGRSQVFELAGIGVIEFTHTQKNMDSLAPNLVWDDAIGMFRATPEYARRDLKRVGRNWDMVEGEDKHDQT